MLAASSALTAAVVLAPGCAVSSREELVGRYEDNADGGRETWTLASDGTCEIVRTAGAGSLARTRCEWEFVDRDGRRRLAVTLLPGEADEPVRHRARLVLAPSRLLGGAVTIPLDGGRELRKVK